MVIFEKPVREKWWYMPLPWILAAKTPEMNESELAFHEIFEIKKKPSREFFLELPEGHRLFENFGKS